MYRVTAEVQMKQQEIYKKQYKPFRPFNSQASHNRIASRYENLITTQNGEDTDDYCVDDTNKVERYLKDIAPLSKVLFLGTGTGREILIAKDMGLDAYGVTLGSRNIDYGRDYLGIESYRLLEALNEDLPFTKNFFNIIAGFQVFEHAMSPLLFLLEARRVLKPGGKLILEWPPANDAYSMGDNPHHQICYTPGQANVLFQKAGFFDIKLFYGNLEPIPVEEYWKGDQKDMLCISGFKSLNRQKYITQSEDL